MLTKRQIILSRSFSEPTDHYVDFAEESDEVFLTIARPVFEDMGAPEEFKVTIETGPIT